LVIPIDREILLAHQWASDKNSKRVLWTFIDKKNIIKEHYFKVFENYGETVVVPHLSNLDSYSSFRYLIKSILEDMNIDAHKILEPYPNIYDILENENYHRPKKLTFAAERIHQAVIRRISRESIYNAFLIDSAARLLIKLIKNFKRHRNKIIILNEFEKIDRPSIRIFYRTFLLSYPSMDIRWIYLFHYPCLDLPKQPNEDLLSKVKNIRLNLIHRLKSLLDPKIIYFNFQNSDPNLFQIPISVTQDYTFTDIAQSLVDQNYEYSMLLSISRILSTKNKNKIAELKRLLAIASANAGLNEESLRLLCDALKDTYKPEMRAHLHYLKGLIYNKRFYDLTAAENEYKMGLEEIDRTQITSVSKIERAWLMNGISFVNVMRSKQLLSSESNKLIYEIIKMEIEAFNLVKGPKDTAHTYLRYNLIANIAFLLEILGDYGKSIKFWKDIFEPYIKDELDSEFNKVLGYRLGLIFFKAGQKKQCEKYLIRALRGALSDKDKFLTERILYALGYVNVYFNNDYKAMTYFKKGLRLSFELREWHSVIDHTIGLIYCNSLFNNINILSKGINLISQQSIKNLINLILNEAQLNKDQTHETIKYKLEKYNIKLKSPSPKLPSYIANVDLEPIPDRDMNLYLAMTPKN